MTGGLGRVEHSDARFEPGGLHFATVGSPALRGRGDLTLFAPPGSEGGRDLPLVILLHGVYDSHWAWTFKGGAHLSALDLLAAGEIPPMVLAMPSDGLRAEGSGYLPWPDADFERWIVEDVPASVRMLVPQVSAASRLYLAGLSMGGWGTLRLGAKYPRLFSGLSAHSSVTHLDALDALLSTPSGYQIAPDEGRTLLWWLTRHPAELPPLRFDCGTDDRYLADNRALHAGLEQAGVAHVYEEFAGGHTWAYWSEHLSDTLRFFARLERQHERSNRDRR